MDIFTSASTLGDDYKLESEQGCRQQQVKQHPFEDNTSLQACLEEVLATGLGFHDWVYDVDTIVRSSLSEDIGSKLSAPMVYFVGMLQ